MEITVKTQADCSATLSASIPASLAGEKRQAIITYYKTSAKIPGFRPGKATDSIIEKKFGESIKEELTNQLFSLVCDEALKENPTLKILHFGTPDHTFNDDGSYTVSTTMTIVPDFELPEYKGIEVTVESDEISDAEIEAELNNLASRMASFEPVERAAEMGDIAVIDFKTSLDGKPLEEALGKPVGFIGGREDYWLTLEEDSYLPGLSTALKGTSAGDTKEVPVTLGDEFPLTDLQGKTILFNVVVKKVQKRVVPEINEELAERLMPGSSLDKIKELLKETLGVRKKQAIEESKADQITEKLANIVNFELPARLIEQEAADIVRQKLQQLLYSGTPENKVEEMMESLKEESQKEAARNLRVYFMLQEIAAKENISVSDDELARDLVAQADRAKKNPKSYIRDLQRKGQIGGMRTRLLTAKVLDFLASEAKITSSAQ